MFRPGESPRPRTWSEPPSTLPATKPTMSMAPLSPLTGEPVPSKPESDAVRILRWEEAAVELRALGADLVLVDGDNLSERTGGAAWDSGTRSPRRGGGAGRPPGATRRRVWATTKPPRGGGGAGAP